MSDYMKKPCDKCPFRIDVTPFLHPERAYDIAVGASNPYNDFHCHKTIEHDDDGNGYAVENSKQCAGFLTMRARETKQGVPKGFEPDFDNVYEDAWDMESAYQEKWDEKH
jgi:hypothetical protein